MSSTAVLQFFSLFSFAESHGAFFFPFLPLCAGESLQVTVQPASTVQKPGGPVSLWCVVDPPRVNLTWRLNGKELDGSRNNKTSTDSFLACSLPQIVSGTPCVSTLVSNLKKKSDILLYLSLLHAQREGRMTALVSEMQRDDT